MNNLNIFENTFAFKPRKLSQDKPDNCLGNCQAQIKGLAFWINNQPYWTYQCKCCNAYHFERGKTSAKWGETYD